MIDIVMATYNGEAYLAEQIESLIAQNYTDWRLIIGDDGSTDRTLEIIGDYKKKCGDKIIFVGINAGNMGACQNFGSLLHQSGSDYCMLCDQDDVWLPEKIQLTLGKMRELEESFGVDEPLLVHSDLTVVDEDLRVLADSGWRSQEIDPVKGCSLNRALVQNVPTGCTMMANKKLRDIALPIPGEAIMHDWWLTLVAAAFGRIGYVKDPTLLYRQHGENVSGAQIWGIARILKRLLNVRNTRNILLDIQKQAGAFLKMYHDDLAPRDRVLIDIFATLSGRSFLERRYYIVKYGFWHTGLVRNVGMLLFC
jgi:glycosyltransferase involved in cell wall biosynthesis